MREILLAKGLIALVDDEDFESINQFRWKRDIQGYASSKIRLDGKQKDIFMHRVIMKVSDRRIILDHVNGNKLDNRRSNLRFATNSQNGMNRGMPSNNTSGFKGVTRHKRTGKWQASINFNGMFRYLGLYANPEDAHAAYCAAALKYHGEFANTGGGK